MSRVIDVDIGFAPMEKKELHQRLDEVRTELDKALLVYERKNPSYTIDQIETVLAGLRAINKLLMDSVINERIKKQR